MTDLKHGNTGYRRGCRCETCRADHAAVAASYRAARKAMAADGDEAATPAPAPVVREPLVMAPTIDLEAAPGLIECAFEADLADDAGDILWVKTLTAMGRLNARLLDQVQFHGRIDQVSGLQLRTLEILNRLAYLKVNGLVGAIKREGDDVSDEEVARKLLEDVLND